MESNQKLFQMLFVFFACLFVVIAQTIYLLIKNKTHDERIFTVTREGLQEQSSKIKSILKRMHISEKNMNSALLLLEEIVVRLQENSEQVVTARVINFYGKVTLLLSSYGNKYNPLENINSAETGSEDYIRNLIFKANTMRLSYKRKRNQNVIVIKSLKRK